jgi:hypothetical protein
MTHLIVIAHRGTALSTRGANLGTGAAGMNVHIGAASHRVGTDLTNIRASLQQRDVGRIGVRATFRKAVRYGLDTDFMTRAACTDA